MRPLFLLALPLLLLLLLAPGGMVTGERVGDSLVQVFAIGPPPEVRLGEQATHTFAVFNGGTATSLVQGRVVSTEMGFAPTLQPSHAFIAPQGSDQFALSLQAPLTGKEGVALTVIEFQVRDLATEEVDTLPLAVETKLLGITPEEDPVGKLFGIWPNPLPAPLDNVYGAFLGTVAVWILIALGVVYLVRPILQRLVEKREGKMVSSMVAIVRGPVFALILLYGAVTSIRILGIPGDILVRLLQAYSFLVIILVTWIVYRIFRDVIIRYGQRRARRSKKDISRRILPSLDKLGGLIIVLAGILVAMQSFGVDVTLLLAGLGVVGLIIAFAAQDTLGNLFAGLHIMLDRPFQVGDLIEVEPGVICEVVDIGLRSTKLYWRKDHNLLIIPNSEIANKKIVNYLRPDFRYRAHVRIGVAYGSDLVKVEEILKDIVLSHPDTLTDEEHPAEFWVDEFGDSSVDCRIIFWIKDARNHWRVRSDVNKQIDRRFKEEGITIPFPQRDVWMKSPPERGGPPPA